MAEDEDPVVEPCQSLAASSIQAMGRGFDLTCDIRLSYCKGVSPLVHLDQQNKKDLRLPGGISIPDAPAEIQCLHGRTSHHGTNALNFDQMSERFNKALSIEGKIPSGLFNAMFSFSGSWRANASTTKSLALDGWFSTLYNLKLAKHSLKLHDEVEREVPSMWDPEALASFIEKHGTHIVTSVTVGGKDTIYVKQHQSSSLTSIEIESYLKELGDRRFLAGSSNPALDLNDKAAGQSSPLTGPNLVQTLGSDGPSSLTGKEDVTVIYRRRGGDDLEQNHEEWKDTIKSNPDVISMTFIPIASLLEGCPGKEHLIRAIDVYLEYKPPIEELQYFLEFQVAKVWAPVQNDGRLPRKEPICPSLQFSLMGPKLFINTEQVSVGRRPVTGLRLSLEGTKANRLCIHIQHLVVLPKILRPHWDSYVAIGAPKWHGPEEQDSRWFEPIQWKNFSHVSTAPIEFNEAWMVDLSGAHVVTGAQLGVWDFGAKSVLYLRLLYSKVPGCTIRRSVWDHNPVSYHHSDASKDIINNLPVSSSGALQVNKLVKFVDTEEMTRGPHDMPGHWLVTGAKLGVEKSQIFLRAKYSLLNY